MACFQLLACALPPRGVHWLPNFGLGLRFCKSLCTIGPLLICLKENIPGFQLDPQPKYRVWTGPPESLYSFVQVT